MKTCRHCGKQNDDYLRNCVGCGSALNPRSKKQLVLLIICWASIALGVSLGAIFFFVRVRQPIPQDAFHAAGATEGSVKLEKARRYANLFLDKLNLSANMTEACVAAQISSGKIRPVDASELSTLVKPVFDKAAVDKELRESFAVICASGLSEDEIDILITFIGSPTADRLLKIANEGRPRDPSFVRGDLTVLTQKPISEAWRKFGEVTLNKRFNESVNLVLQKYQTEIDEKIAFVSKQHLKK